MEEVMTQRNSNTKIVIRCSKEEKAALLLAKSQIKARTWLEMFQKLLHRKKIEPPKTIIQDSIYLLEILTELKRCGNNLNQVTKLANTNKTITPKEAAQLKKLAVQISSLKNKVLRSFVVDRGK